MDRSKLKSALLLSHEMSMTGAPVALQYMAKQLKKDGIFVTVLSPKDGPMVGEMLKDDITVIIDETIGGNTEWLKWASNFDMIVVCTVVPYHNIIQLEETDMPVIWWIHDGEMSFQLGANAVLPQKLSKNIHVYAGGKYACEVVKKYRPAYEVEELLYCVPDYSKELPEQCGYIIDNPDGKIIISSVGSIDERKGQDILVQAIRRLNQNEIARCLFVFVGRNNDKKVYEQVTKLRKDYPENIRMISEVSRDEIADIYRQSEVVVCTSRDDPMPVFMTESLMLGVPVICSDHTGTYGLLTDGVNGIGFHNENVAELGEKLAYVIHNEVSIKEIGARGREVYEKNFTEEAFRASLYRVIEQI